MSDSWITTTLLLQQLQASDDTAWSDFLQRFREPIVRFARHLGVPEADADDVAQETLVSFVQTWRKGRYDRSKGRLSSWLFVLARQRIGDHHRRAGRERDRRDPAGNQSELWGQLADEEAVRHTWDATWGDVVLERCLERVRTDFRAKTMAAFEAFVLQERSAEDVAAELDMSPNAVFIAKHRVLKRLRELQAEYESVA